MPRESSSESTEFRKCLSQLYPELQVDNIIVQHASFACVRPEKVAGASKLWVASPDLTTASPLLTHNDADTKLVIRTHVHPQENYEGLGGYKRNVGKSKNNTYCTFAKRSMAPRIFCVLQK